MIFRMARVALNSVSARLFFAQIVVAGTALIVNIFAARALGPEARGELALFMQIAYVANAISLLGRHRAYLKLDGDKPLSLASSIKDTKQLTRVPLLVSILVAFVVAVVVSNAIVAGLVFALGLFTLIYSGVQQKTFRSSTIVSRDSRAYFVSTLIGQVLLLSGAIALAWSDISLVSVWLLVYGVSVLGPYLLTSWWLTCRNHDSASKQWQLREIKSLGLRLMPMSVAEIVGARTDRFLIPALGNFAQLGIYTVVVTMTELIAWPVKNYTDSKVPRWAREMSAARFNVFKEVAIVATGIVGISLVTGVVLERILTPLFGQEFAAGQQLVWPLVLAAALHAFMHLGTNLSLAAGYTHLVNAIPLTGVFTSTALYFLFIPSMGALGAAWGLVLGYSAALLVSIVGVVRIARIK